MGNANMMKLLSGLMVGALPLFWLPQAALAAHDAWVIHMPENTTATPSGHPHDGAAQLAALGDGAGQKQVHSDAAHVIRLPEDETKAKPSSPVAETQAPERLVDDATARAWLDYKLYGRVERAMRWRIQRDAYDGAAWLLLARALEGQGKVSQAAEARRRARAYGTGERGWHVSLKLGGFVDSNVVIAPESLHLPARDKGDIGARVALSASGRMADFAGGYLGWRLAYADMLYQDFNAYALRNVQAQLAQHIAFGDGHDVYLGLAGEQSTLGGNNFFAGWQMQGGVGLNLGEHLGLRVDAFYGRRNFTVAFSDYSSWRWQARHRLDWKTQAGEAGFEFSIAREQTRLGLEAYRRIGAGAHLGWLAASFGSIGDVWLKGRVDVARRAYQLIDTRPFLKAALKRKDNESRVIGALELQRHESLWGSQISELWQWQTGWQKNASNFDVLAVFDPAQSRSWKRWWSEVSVQWQY